MSGQRHEREVMIVQALAKSVEVAARQARQIRRLQIQVAVLSTATLLLAAQEVIR